MPKLVPLKPEEVVRKLRKLGFIGPFPGGLHIAKIAGADTNWYHCDALGSPRKMTNESGSVVWTGAYQPFGEMIVGSGDVHRFTGKELDETGLNYFCQRYYDSQIGRFMTRDLIPTPAFSSYSYCLNNPLKYIDIDGAVIKFMYATKKWEERLNSYAKKYMPEIWNTLQNAPEEILVGYLPPWATTQDPFIGGGFLGSQGIGIHPFAFQQGRYGYFSLEQIYCHELWHAYYWLEGNPENFGSLYEEEMNIYMWMGERGWLDFDFLKNIGDILKEKGYMRKPPSGGKPKKTSYYHPRGYNKLPMEILDDVDDPNWDRRAFSYWYWKERLLEKTTSPVPEEPLIAGGGGW